MSVSPGNLKPPQQSRSRRTLERLVRASLSILEREGAEGLTVQAIVAAADSSVGSFYARFAGKDDLLDYLGDRVWRDAADRWDQALASRDWAGLGLREAVSGAVSLMGEAGRARTTHLKALEGTPQGGLEAFRAFHSHVLEGLAELLLQRRQEIVHPDPTLAVHLGLQAVLGILDAPDPADGEPIGLERRMEEANRLLLAYLSGESDRGHPPTGQVDFFDIWG